MICNEISEKVEDPASCGEVCYALYLTPLYAATLRHPALHLLMHAHFLLAGYLFSWALIGLDPIPHRASFATRAVVLVLALGAHGTLAKLLYANGASIAGLRTTGAGVDDWRLGAQIMWYGGNVVDVALVFVFFLQWYIAGGRRRVGGGAYRGRGAPLRGRDSSGRVTASACGPTGRRRLRERLSGERRRQHPGGTRLR